MGTITANSGIRQLFGIDNLNNIASCQDDRLRDLDLNTIDSQNIDWFEFSGDFWIDAYEASQELGTRIIKAFGLTFNFSEELREDYGAQAFEFVTVNGVKITNSLELNEYVSPLMVNYVLNNGWSKANLTAFQSVLVSHWVLNEK